MTDNERNMSRDEMALRLKIETGLRESYESECTKLKKELEDIKVAFKMEHDENILRRDSLDRLCDKYRELEKKHEDLQKRQNACADTWVKCEERNDELKRTLEAKNEEIELLKKELKERRVAFEPTSYQRDIKAKDDEIKTLRKENLDLKNTNEVLGLKYDQAFLNKKREITALKDEIEALKDALHDDEVEIHKLKEERDDYSADIDDYEKEVSSFVKKVSSLEKDISSANKRVEAYKRDYYRVLNAYCDLRAKYEPTPLDLYNMKQNPGYFVPTTQPINIENLNVTYYENGPVWTNDDSGEEETADIHATLKEED